MIPLHRTSQYIFDDVIMSSNYIGIGASYHEADLDETDAYVQLWFAGQKSLAKVVQVLKHWKTGCYA